MQNNNSKKTVWTPLVLIVTILSIAGCDNVSVLGDNDVDTGPGPRSVDTEDPVEPNIPDDSAPDSPILLYLKDVNADGIQDIAVIAEDSANKTLTATVKDTNNILVNYVSFSDNCRLLSAVSLPDINGDLRMDLAVFCRQLSTGALKVEIRDPLGGSLIREVGFDRDLQFLFASTVEDMNGDGNLELAALFKGPAPDDRLFAQIIDPLSGTTINNVGFDKQLTPKGFLSIRDINVSGIPELVLLGETRNGEFRSVIRDAQSDILVSNQSLGSQLTVKQLSVAQDRNGNLVEEIAALREENSFSVLLYHARDGSLSNVVNFSPSFKFQKMLIVADMNGNGALELAILGNNPETGTIKSEVRDARTGDLLNNISWPTRYKPVDTVSMADINLNDSQELVYLGQRKTNGKLVVLIKDAMTSELLGTVDF